MHQKVISWLIRLYGPFPAHPLQKRTPKSLVLKNLISENALEIKIRGRFIEQKAHA